jgi:hypothetical protein
MLSQPAGSLNMSVRLSETSVEVWEPVPRWALASWLTFYGLFILYALCNRSGFLLIDYVNLPVHEGGHLLFGWFGQTIGVLGGTLLQLVVPAALTVYFVSQRQPSGTTFCAFFFFENLLNISTYMADARAQQLALVTVGDGEDVIHDWFFLFSKLGVLEHDLEIAHLVRAVAWLGMLGTVGWLVQRAWQDR